MKSSCSYLPQTLTAPLDSICGLVIAHYVPACLYFSDIVQW